MNPNRSTSASLATLIGSIWKNRGLVYQLTQRDISGRYRGSTMGVAWSFITPLLMLAVYTFVFSVIFKSRWGEGEQTGKAQFAIVLFVGMIVHGLFAEVVNRAPGLIQSNVNYVKKVVFPLEILPLVTIGTALFHAFISILVLAVVIVAFNESLAWTVILIVPVLMPLTVLTLGLAWFLASLGVYLRDIGQITTIITTILLFLSPVFFPISAVPKEFQVLIGLNPLTFIINQARNVLVWGNQPDWVGLLLYTAIASLAAWLGFAWFQRTRKGFSDVI